MPELLEQLIPNIMEKPDILWSSIIETLVMTGISGSVSFVIGLFLGVVVTVTAPGNIMENPPVFHVLDKVINIFRSIPFIVLLPALFPLSRMAVGTAIGVRGAIIPLIFGTVPFFARQIETALAELDHGLIEAAQSMGSSPVEIIFRVYLKESIAAITRGTTITAISLVGLTAMAGAIGAGGLGDFAIRYGHQRHQVDVTYVTIFILVLMVSVIQVAGNYIAKKSTH